MPKAIKTVAAVAAIAGLAVVTGGAALGLGVSLGTSAFGVSAGALLATSSALSIGSSLAFKPKAPATSTSASDRLQVSIDTRAARKMVFGTTAFATDLRDQEFTGSDQDLVHRFIVNASHQVAAYREIWLDDKLAWSAAGGVTSAFAGYLLVDVRTVGNAGNALNISSRMGATRRYTGCAYVHMRFKVTGNSKKAESPFAQSIPSRVTVIGDGALTYDPRLDSTVPGGSGPQRANDQTTWVWNAEASRSPALQLLWYLLGWRIQNPVTGEWRLAVGKGIPAERIDLASFITAANHCDEPVTLAGGGTQPRYRSDGVFSESDATSTVVDQLKAAMNAELDDVDGKLRLTVIHNDLATPIVDLTTDDVIGAYKWNQTTSLEETYNVWRGTFIDPSQNSLFQAVDYPEIRIASRDGIDRVQTVNFQTVQNSAQAQRLIRQMVARSLYAGRFTANFSHRAWKAQKGDVVRLTFSPLGWTNKLFRVVEADVQVNGQVPLTLQVEHPDIYLWDRDERAAIQPVEPTQYDPLLNPVYQGIEEAGGTAIWNNVTGDGKPENNATVGAPGNSPVGDAEAQAVVDGLLANMFTVAESALRDGLYRVEKDEQLTLPGGVHIRQLVDQLGAVVDGVQTMVQFLRSVDSAGNALWSLTAQNSTGAVTGVKNLLTGQGLGRLSFVADILEAVDPDGGNAKFIFRYGLDNRLILSDVYIEKLEVGAVQTASIAANAVSSGDSVTLASPIAGDGTWRTALSYYASIPVQTPAVNWQYVAIITGSQSFPNGDRTWDARLKIDGALVGGAGAAGGMKSEDSFAMSGRALWGSGSHNFTVEWKGEAGCSLAGLGMVILWFKR